MISGLTILTKYIPFFPADMLVLAYAMDEVNPIERIKKSYKISVKSIWNSFEMQLDAIQFRLTPNVLNCPIIFFS